MTLEEIYTEYTAGSQGFVAAVDTHCGYDSDRAIIEAIGDIAKSAAEFDRIWTNPTADEIAAVEAAAQEIEPDEDLHWGDHTIPAKA